MNIVVCVKQVPDTTAKKELGPDFSLNRDKLDSVINPFDEYAIEEALRLKDEHGGTVTIVTMGPASAEDSMRKALAMGADAGVLISDPALKGSDWYGTSRVLAAGIRQLEYDLIVTGTESTDARTGLIPGGLAELLGIPLLSYASHVQARDGSIRINRQISGGYEQVEAPVPVLVSVAKGANEPRYPSLKGIMAAKRKEVRKIALADLGLDAQDVGLQGARSVVTEAVPRPGKAAGQVLRPDSPEDAARAIADFLESKKFL
ncbi:MAG: electron transfer flavoprotein subunit beta/FixA family protein [Acidobacteriaceae bacterium]